MGNAYALADAAADVLFYHPGMIGEATGVVANVASAAEPGALFTAAGAADWFGGTVVVGLSNAAYGTGADGAAGLARVEADLAAQGARSASETVVSVGFGRNVGPVMVGTTARLFSARSGGSHDRSPALDVGAAADLGFGYLALSALAIGGDLTMGGESVDLPTLLSLGFATESVALGPVDVAVAAAVDRQRGGDVRPGGGVEVGYWPVQGRTFVGRVGYDHAVDDDPASGLTWGASLRGDTFRLDYAWGRVDDDRSIHRLGVRWQ